MMEINETFIIISILVFAWVEYFWEFYLSSRQLKVYRETKCIPNELASTITTEEFEKARLYGKHKLSYGMVKQLYSICFSSLVLWYGLAASAWRAALACIPAGLNVTEEHQITISLVFVTLVTLYSTLIDQPFSLYYTFVLEEKHGFNKQTLGFYIKDQIKGLLVGLMIVLPLVSAIIYIIQIGGNMLVIWLWVFASITTIVLLMVYPAVIAPLFDKFTPLPSGSLRSGIENLAASLKFPLSQVYIVEGSKRSAHSNAYFAGVFGAKRIVLFDTLIEKYSEEKKCTTGCSEKEILGVLAHELGHWSCNHIYKFIGITEVNLLMLFSAFGFFFKYSLLYTALGFPAGQEPIVVGLIAVMQIVLAPYNALLSYFTTILSRKFEYEADDFAIALKYGKELSSSLTKLSKDNLEFPVYDELYSSWHHSHPTILHRLESIRKKSE